VRFIKDWLSRVTILFQKSPGAMAGRVVVNVRCTLKPIARQQNALFAGSKIRAGARPERSDGRSIAKLNVVRTPPIRSQHWPPDRVTADEISEGIIRILRIKIDVIRIVIAVVPTRRLQTEADTCAPRGSRDGAVAIAIISCRRRLRDDAP